MLLDGESLELAQAIEPVLREAGGSGPLKPELMQCQVEISTSPCSTAAEALDELTELRRGLLLDAAACGIRVAAAERIRSRGWRSSESRPVIVTARWWPRFAFRHVGSSSSACTCTSPSAAARRRLRPIEALLPDLPILLALSTSSPFLDGEATGFASTRNVLGNAMRARASRLVRHVRRLPSVARTLACRRRDGRLDVCVVGRRLHPSSAPSSCASWTSSRSSRTRPRSRTRPGARSPLWQGVRQGAGFRAPTA